MSGEGVVYIGFTINCTEGTELETVSDSRIGLPGSDCSQSRRTLL